MQLFDEIIGEIRDYISEKELKGIAKRKKSTGRVKWPSASNQDIVLKDNVGLELGRPQDISSSFLLWTNNTSLVKDNMITLVGDDVAGCREKHLSYGRVVLIGGSDFDEENCNQRYQEMLLARNDVSLKGYMVRAVSRYMKEWVRISKEAVDKGFSLFTLGNALIEIYKQIDYIDSVEILIVTSGIDEITKFSEIGDRAIQYLNAVRKMGEEMDFDCGSCEYESVCDEVGDLKSMRDVLQKKEK